MTTKRKADERKSVKERNMSMTLASKRKPATPHIRIPHISSSIIIHCILFHETF
jgi:hypothetical protein